MTGDPGNAETVRVIANQLFETWKSEQGRQRASWPAWLGLFLSVAGIVFVAGSLTGEVAEANTRSKENSQKIEALERQNTAVEKGLARIEAKVDILMDERKR